MHSWWKSQDFSKIESGPNYTTAAHAFVKATLRLGLRAPLAPAIVDNNNNNNNNNNNDDNNNKYYNNNNNNTVAIGGQLKGYKSRHINCN